MPAIPALPPPAPVRAADLGVPRHQIARDDRLLWIFNGYGKCNPLRYSLTGFGGLNYVDNDGGYRFRFDFVEKRSGARILDNVPEIMSTEDPLGWNFRAGTPMCLLVQDETWYPHRAKPAVGRVFDRLRMLAFHRKRQAPPLDCSCLIPAEARLRARRPLGRIAQFVPTAGKTASEHCARRFSLSLERTGESSFLLCVRSDFPIKL